MPMRTSFCEDASNVFVVQQGTQQAVHAEICVPILLLLLDGCLQGLPELRADLGLHRMEIRASVARANEFIVGLASGAGLGMLATPTGGACESPGRGEGRCWGA